VQAKLGGKLENGPLLRLGDSMPFCILGSKPLDLMVWALYIAEMTNCTDSREFIEKRGSLDAESRVEGPSFLAKSPG
jgi:hypothetical protein